MRKLHNLFLLIVAIILFVPTAPIVFLVNSIRWFKRDYWLIVAIGIDQLGGSILYGEEDWTISSYTHFLCFKYGRFCWLEKFINFWFGEGHCERSYINEQKKMLKEIG